MKFVYFYTMVRVFFITTIPTYTCNEGDTEPCGFTLGRKVAIMEVFRLKWNCYFLHHVQYIPNDKQFLYTICMSDAYT